MRNDRRGLLESVQNFDGYGPELFGRVARSIARLAKASHLAMKPGRSRRGVELMPTSLLILFAKSLSVRLAVGIESPCKSYK
jgi:hypothetical protein